MQLIVDTSTGLAIVSGSSDFSCLDAVIIGRWQLPPAIGVLDDGYLSVAPAKLAEVLDLRSERECRAYRRLVHTLRRANGPVDRADGGQIRIRVAEWLAH